MVSQLFPFPCTSLVASLQQRMARLQSSTGELLESRRIWSVHRARGLPGRHLQSGRPTDKTMCLRSAMCAEKSLIKPGNVSKNRDARGRQYFVQWHETCSLLVYTKHSRLYCLQAHLRLKAWELRHDLRLKSKIYITLNTNFLLPIPLRYKACRPRPPRGGGPLHRPFPET